MEKYKEIITLAPHVSETRPRMPQRDRAAQFAPFAALTGFEDDIRETARQVRAKTEISEEIRERIDRTLRYLSLWIEREPQVRVVYFVRDKRKNGGAYYTEEVAIKKIDTVKTALILTDDRKIPLDDLADIQILSG
ncbi:MAG: hypothetical protein IJT27_01505 [Clostridia bacterium]|nr:hypothetical protein [Clostridia bacterium]